MYYEETVIKGIINFRTSPKGEWKPLSAQRLSTEIMCLRIKYKQLCEKADKATGLWNDAKYDAVLASQMNDAMKQLESFAKQGL